MKIGIIGASGKAGRLIAAEASLRGHEVKAFVRKGKKLAGKNYTVVEKDLFSLEASDFDSLDAVVNAFGTAFDPASAIQHQTSMEHLIKVFETLPNIRLLIVGGAGSLYSDKSKKSLVLESIPAEWRAIPENMAAAFEKLKKSHVNWTYFSPAVNFDAEGRRTRSYTTDYDVAAVNNAGESYISYRDYAFAMVDEIEQKKYEKRRFTAAAEKDAVLAPSEKPYYGILEKKPTFEGMSRYRPPLNFELAGKRFTLLFDNGIKVLVRFISEDTLSWDELGSSSYTGYYECAKIDEITYFVNFEFANSKPRVNHIVVLDLEQNLTTLVKTKTNYDPEYPLLCDFTCTFGAIVVPGVPVSNKRHGYTQDLLGKRIHWHYTPELEIIHVYYSTSYMRVAFTEGEQAWGNMPTDDNPYDEKAAYIKIKDNIYLISLCEQNEERRGLGGNSLVFLIDTERVHDIGRSFGVTGTAPEFMPENYIFGAYGDFVHSDGVLEAKKRIYSE
jgi:putative NADH-flavin reductase